MMQCKNCTAFQRVSPTHGECREGPPTVTIMLMPTKASIARPGEMAMEVQTPSAFPPVREEHWCRRFEPKIKLAS